MNSRVLFNSIAGRDRKISYQEFFKYLSRFDTLTYSKTGAELKAKLGPNEKLFWGRSKSRAFELPAASAELHIDLSEWADRTEYETYIGNIVRSLFEAVGSRDYMTYGQFVKAQRRYPFSSSE